MSKILIAVHGHEPRGWMDQAVRALPPGATTIKILVVLDAPAAAFTSLLPAARRRFAAARRQWRQLAEAQIEPSIAALAGALPAPSDIETILIGDGDAGRAIVRVAREWRADLVVVGRDTRGRFARFLLAATHQQVADGAPCAVCVTPGDGRSPAAMPFGGRRITGGWPAAMGDA